MPSKSEKQHKMMEAVAHSKKFADKVGVPQKVGKEYAKADERKKADPKPEKKESKAVEKKEEKKSPAKKK
jgi:hypothetical protein